MHIYSGSDSQWPFKCIYWYFTHCHIKRILSGFLLSHFDHSFALGIFSWMHKIEDLTRRVKNISNKDLLKLNTLTSSILFDWFDFVQIYCQLSPESNYFVYIDNSHRLWPKLVWSTCYWWFVTLTRLPLKDYQAFAPSRTPDLCTFCSTNICNPAHPQLCLVNVLFRGKHVSRR